VPKDQRTVVPKGLLYKWTQSAVQVCPIYICAFSRMPTVLLKFTRLIQIRYVLNTAAVPDISPVVSKPKSSEHLFYSEISY